MADEEIKPAEKLPQHIAVIMDGNGRWAKARGLPRTAGHKAGVDAVRETLETATAEGIKFLTLYAFSNENWGRPEDEVTGLMQLLRFYLKSELVKLHEKGVRFRVIGDRTRFAADIQEMIANAETLTFANNKITLVIALSYGARQEILQAAIRIAKQVKGGAIDIADISKKEFAAGLYTNDIPDPDLIIRTSGEQRLSNFMLWQAAYAEFYFTDTLWPDFGRDALLAAIADFQSRERRFGGLAVATQQG